ncbi:MAG: NADH-quinone oxidoreductase subunit N [Candidatus Solibacter usitatus]|nr:NADH-quinone oxidoreductase subunit N [Candidatus Solibacter usitatus]
MPANFVPSTQELLRFAPEMLLTLVATLLMMLEAISGPGGKRKFAWIAFFSLAAAIALAISAAADPGPAFSAMLVIDGYSTFFRVLVMVVGLLTILISNKYLDGEGHQSGEYYALLLFSIIGQSIMATANELIMIFIGLECSSIATYVLAGYLRDDKRNNESALKYFLLGSFATAFLLFGVAWIYGLTGTTNLTQIRAALLDPQAHPNMLILGAATAMMFVGFAFKISAAPFQMWAPDVYQGAPAPVAAFMSAGPKAAAFAMFLRVLMTAFEPVKDRWEPILWTSTLATMVIGNFSALRQSNIKRLLAYSSIAHAGYVLVAVTTHSEIGIAAAMFYLASYALMNIGAFAIVTHVARKGEQYVEISDFAGLSQRQPLVAAMLTVFLLSLTGIPLTAGFFGKFYIFKAALDANMVWLAVLGMLNSAVAAYYYLRVIVVMYMHAPAEGAAELPAPSAGIRLAVLSTAIATIALGIFPSFVLDYAGKSAALIR